ncbi:AAA family ATPase [Mycolicibacterium sp. 018/SC-01/001]|uniref:septum site-determining protein Ssd n=1 Tax=Mycolicibacterium sp. 018/SC-01/001 TaxID=2592069 RepID=UPI00117C09DD|nr:septum site-determining protein Ssd [Mycolicibacterium sp. 018/SC-01/001]TRW80078.1 AAA family ATPase [Mycolicibacterium sp. 018/SC-01/001]
MTGAAILIVVSDPALRAVVDRVVAASAVRAVRSPDAPDRRGWAGAGAIVLDGAAARACTQRALPRRAGVVLISASAPDAALWEAAVAVGAQHVLTLPAQEADLMTAVTEAVTEARDSAARGPVVAVMSGRGGGGASVFSVALARAAREPLLVDADPWGGGLDLVLGSETEPGLRWPDLSLDGGRLTYQALRDALPRRHGVAILAGSRVLAGERPAPEINPRALIAVLDAGSRAGVTVVCDVAHRPGAASDVVLASADLVVLVTPADVRSCAAAAATAHWAQACNPNTGLLVRGPAPGGLRPIDVARIVGLPLLASMRPQPGLDQQLERGGLRLRGNAPLTAAARTVLAVLPTTRAAGVHSDVAA